MTGIEVEKRSEVVGGVYSDMWTDRVRVQMDEWECERKMDPDDFYFMIEDSGYKFVETGNSERSGKIVNVYEREICKSCGEEALYDAIRAEFYCPVCES